MPNALLPELNGRQLTVDYALKSPTIIRDRIAALADSQLLLGHLFRAYGAPVQGGALAYSVLSSADLYTTAIEKRTPGAEYRVVEGVEPEPRLAPVEDWGGKVVIPNERVVRNDVNYLDQVTTQLSNTIARKIDTRAVATLNAANPASIAVPTPWDNLVTVGDPATLTSSLALPTAAFAEAQEITDLDEMGVVLDKLIVSPGGARALRTAYGRDLAAVLESAGLVMVSNPRIADGVAYVVQSGQVGTIAFEAPLTVDVWEDKSTRSWVVQAFAVPAFAVDRPYAVKKLLSIN
ncbi:major capsid protein [Mycolicibacterium mengxianglii]|uniref:major capsid protein n=1 Tax=Mycolicibacterium mengxianglii TaxID=2736649 RepID=UPI0018CFF2D0|nr:major capsid protein [Mycolicibacterium mengxianglii]